MAQLEADDLVAMTPRVSSVSIILKVMRKKLASILASLFACCSDLSGVISWFNSHQRGTGHRKGPDLA